MTAKNFMNVDLACIVYKISTVKTSQNLQAGSFSPQPQIWEKFPSHHHTQMLLNCFNLQYCHDISKNSMHCFSYLIAF